MNNYFQSMKITFEYCFCDVFIIGFIMFFLGVPKHLSIGTLKPFIKEPFAFLCKVKKKAPPKGCPNNHIKKKEPPIAGGFYHLTRTGRTQRP